nr:iron ABC transporter permease [uncultured Lachnoanaerobaculum sp.]
MLNKKIKLDFWNIVTFLIIIVFAIFLIYPLLSLFLDGFKDSKNGAWSLMNYIQFFSKKYYISALVNSFKLTISVTVIAVLIGVPLAYFMSFYKIKGKGVLEVLFIISMMSPNFIGAYSWILLLGRNGSVTKFLEKALGINMPSIYGFAGMLLVFSLKLYPFIYIYVSGALKKIDVALSEAAESLGCGGLKKVFTVIMPLITPTLVAAALLVFMNCMADFGTPALIGEGYRVMPTLVYSEFVGESGGSANFAACMATIMIIITALVFFLQKWYINTKSFTMSSIRPIQPKEPKGIFKVLIYIYIYLLAGLSIIPQAMVVYTSFKATKMQVFVDGFSLGSYKKVADKALAAVTNTYVFCFFAIVIIITLGMLIAYLTVRRRSVLTSAIDSIAMFPYIVPGSVLGITLLIAFNHQPLMLAGTAFIIIISLVIRRLAYTLRSSSAILYQISPSMEEAAVSLGDTPAKSFVKVTAKMMLPGVASGAILSWITIINELSSSVMLYTSKTKTMSVAIYNEVIRASYGPAAALASILTLTTVISLLVFFKVSGSKDVTM